MNYLIVLTLTVTCVQASVAQQTVDLFLLDRVGSKESVLAAVTRLQEHNTPHTYRYIGEGGGARDVSASGTARLGDVAVFVSPKLSAPFSVDQLYPEWITDPVSGAVSAYMPIETSVITHYAKVNPQTAAIQRYSALKQYIDLGDLAVPAGFKLGSYTSPTHPDLGIRQGFYIEDAASLHALYETKNPKYGEAIAALQGYLKPSYNYLLTLQQELGTRQVANIVHYCMSTGKGALETSTNFTGEKPKYLSVPFVAGGEYPKIVTAYFEDEYDDLLYPVGLGRYVRRTPVDSIPSARAIMYKYGDGFSSSAAASLGGTLDAGNPIYVTGLQMSAVVDRKEYPTQILRYVHDEDAQAEYLVSRLANSSAIQLVSDFVPVDDYYQQVGIRPEKRQGATHVLALNGDHYDLTSTENDGLLGVASARDRFNELDELLTMELETGSRVLRIVGNDLKKMKYFYYYKPIRLAYNYFDTYKANRVEQEEVDGKKVRRFVAVADVVEHHQGHTGDVRLMRTYKDKKQLAAALLEEKEIVLSRK